MVNNVEKMLVCLFIPIMLACSHQPSGKEILLSEKPIEHLSFQCYPIDSVLLYPRSLNIYQNYLIVMEPQLSDSIYSLWDKNSKSYVCSFGSKGPGPNELINPRFDYYFSTDSTFFILDSNIEREACLKDNQLTILRNNPIVIPDAINQLIKIGVDEYITSGFTSGEKGEHILYKNGDYSFFGDYPDKSVEHEDRFKLNYKLSAGHIGKQLLLDFYLHKNLIRIYDFAGNLMNEINVKNGNFKERADVSFFKLKANSSFVATLYNEEYTMSELYSGVTYNLEFQLWSWSGELERRIVFDKPFDLYSISEDNILYALNSESPYVIYVYDFDR